jgi:hypothetical protein
MSGHVTQIRDKKDTYKILVRKPEGKRNRSKEIVTI